MFIEEIQCSPHGIHTEWKILKYAEPLLKLEGAADRWNFREDDDDYYTQPGLLFRLISPKQKKEFFENTARSIGQVPEMIQLCHVGNYMKADPACGKGVAKALKIPMNKIPK